MGSVQELRFENAGGEAIVDGGHRCASILMQLQLDQFRHDETYHREICRLTVHHRLNHMALHFSKYVGQLATVTETEDQDLLIRTLTDIFIIGVSSANILNMKLAESLVIGGGAGIEDLRDAGLRLCETRGVDQFNALWLLLEISRASGRMAKACESVDHLEAFPFKETISEAVIEISTISLMAAALLDLNLVDEIRERLADVKERMIFHGQI